MGRHAQVRHVEASPFCRFGTRVLCADDLICEGSTPPLLACRPAFFCRPVPLWVSAMQFWRLLLWAAPLLAAAADENKPRGREAVGDGSWKRASDPTSDPAGLARCRFAEEMSRRHWLRFSGTDTRDGSRVRVGSP